MNAKVKLAELMQADVDITLERGTFLEALALKCKGDAAKGNIVKDYMSQNALSSHKATRWFQFDSMLTHLESLLADET